MSVSHIPLPLLEEARSEGLPDDLIAKQWGKYVDWHTKTFRDGDFRMRDWQRQIAFAKRDIQESVPATPVALAASKAEDDKRRQAAEDAEYNRRAMSYATWCGLLVEADVRGYELSDHERRVAGWWQDLRGAKPEGVNGVMDYGDYASLSGVPTTRNHEPSRLNMASLMANLGRRDAAE